MFSCDEFRPKLTCLIAGEEHYPPRLFRVAFKHTEMERLHSEQSCGELPVSARAILAILIIAIATTAVLLMDALREQPKVNDRQGPLDFGPGSPTVRIQMPIDDEIGLNRAAVPPDPAYRGYFSGFKFEEIDEDPIHDLALLKLNANPFTNNAVLKTRNGDVKKIVQVKAARFSLGRPDEGEPIAVSGYPLRSSVMVTTSGAIASSWEVDQKDLPLGAPGAFLSHLSDSYLADIHVNHGNSGGPVFSVADGSVIGVCVSIVPDSMGGSPYNSGLSSMIPAKYVIGLLKKHNLKWLSTSTSHRTD